MTSFSLQLQAKCKTVFTFKNGFLYFQECKLSWCEYFSKETNKGRDSFTLLEMSIVYCHLHLIDPTAGCCFVLGFFSLQGAESLVSTIYSLLCPLNTSFRPSPLCFSAHTYFFFHPELLYKILCRGCAKMDVTNRHRSFMLIF